VTRRRRFQIRSPKASKSIDIYSRLRKTPSNRKLVILIVTKIMEKWSIRGQKTRSRICFKTTTKTLSEPTSKESFRLINKTYESKTRNYRNHTSFMSVIRSKISGELNANDSVSNQQVTISPRSISTERMMPKSIKSKSHLNNSVEESVEFDQEKLK
jgi:hypothetical protein